MSRFSPASWLAMRSAEACIALTMTALTKNDWVGLEHFPTQGGFLVCANHGSYADPLAIGHFMFRAGYPPHFMAKSGMFETPLIGPWMTACRQVPVFRGTGRAAEAFAHAAQAIAEGKCVVVMPEGTLTRDPDLWPMVGKTGAARVALQTRCPVIPLAHLGPHELLDPYGPFHPFPRKTMHMRVGPPIDLSDLHDRPVDEVLREATERIMSAITAELETLRGEKAPEGRWDPDVAGRVDPRTGKLLIPTGLDAS